MARRSSAVREPVETAVRSALAAWLAQRARAQAADPTPPRVAVALSGGRDSMVLLDAVARVAPTLHVGVTAVHVQHGLSPNAEAWAAFCTTQCARRAVPLRIERLQIVRSGGESIEALARALRIDALRRSPVHAVLLAHHADDQAETLLLQLLRGAGPRGLAGMAAARQSVDGPALLRPLLALPARELATYAQDHALAWIEDESNADTRFRRNALRHDILPMVRAAFPGLPGTLVRAAAHQAEAARLLDDLAGLDAAPLIVDDAALGLALRRASLAALASARPDRARNVLRWFLRRHGLREPSQARLEELLAQCMAGRPDARMRLAHDGQELGTHRGLVVVHAPVAGSFRVPWRGEAELVLPGGMLHAAPVTGAGIAVDVVAGAALEVRARTGGERLRLTSQAPQSVSAHLQAAATPLWQRAAWPLVWHDDVLIAVPGLGVDPCYAAAPTAPGLALDYAPRR